MTSGSISLNGVTDAAVALIFEHKAREPHLIKFSPQAMVPTAIGNKSVYNNVTFVWEGQTGFNAVMQLVNQIASKHDGQQSGA